MHTCQMVYQNAICKRFYAFYTVRKVQKKHRYNRGFGTLKKTKTNKALKEAQFEIWNNLKQKTKGTKKGDASRMAILSIFLLDNEDYHSPKDLDSNTANRYVNFLINRFDYKASSLNRQNKFLKMFVKFCFEQGLITKNTIEIVVKFHKPKEIKHLTAVELDLIRQTVFCKRLEPIKDVFLFACNTGLAFCDLVKLNKHHLHQDQLGRKYLRISRNKTETECIIPLSTEALTIWQKYNAVLPLISYTKYNAYIKEVAEQSGVNQHISTHTASVLVEWCF